MVTVGHPQAVEPVDEFHAFDAVGRPVDAVKVAEAGQSFERVGDGRVRARVIEADLDLDASTLRIIGRLRLRVAHLLTDGVGGTVIVGVVST